MRRWMLIVTTAAACGLGMTAAQTPPAPIHAPKPVMPPPVNGSTVTAPATPAVTIPEYSALQACASCGAGGGAKTRVGQRVEAHFSSKVRPAPYCDQCGTCACEWRFLFGSCRAYFEEGRFAPVVGSVPSR